MLLDGDEWRRTFDAYERDAWRFEAQPTYTMPREAENVARFLRGEPKPADHNARWHERVRGYVAAGRTVGRAGRTAAADGLPAEPKEAADWLGERIAEFATRFFSAAERDTTRLAALVNSAGEQLRGGGDVSHGFSLERPSFLSLALVTCSPNRAKPELTCPAP
ncbi:DUF6879 family protein [Streptomyces bluensis]|uniref:DUF6879 family protein n=1 Tax=Streptomyces bluensis TaxID=33897 RepID=A0ABW6USJ2_9ACTN